MKSDRFQLLQLALSVLLFGVTTVFAALWYLLSGFLPPGVDPDARLASIGLRSAEGGMAGVRLGLMEESRLIPGVSGTYLSRPTRFDISLDNIQSEVGAAFVNAEFFEALSVPIRGAGFSHANDRQQVGQRECILSRDLAKRLRAEGEVLGSALEVRGDPCIVVGIVTTAFRGLRAHRPEDMWLGWPSAWGLVVPAVAPLDYFEREVTGREAGVRIAAGSVHRLRADIETLAQRLGLDDIRVELFEGEGLDPEQRRAAMTQVSLFWLASLNLLVIGAALLVAGATWRAERRKDRFAVRSALGATPGRLLRSVLGESAWSFLIAAAIGAAVAQVGYVLVVRLDVFDPVRTHLPSAPGIHGYSLALVAHFAIAAVCAAIALGGVRAAIASSGSGLQFKMQKTTRRDWLERATVGAVVGLATFSAALAWGVQGKHHELQARPMGYAKRTAAVTALRPPGTMEEMRLYAAPDAPVPGLRAELEALLGAGRVALASSAPFRTTRMTLPAVAAAASGNESATQVAVNHVDPDYFRLLGIAFQEGSTFSGLVADEVVVSRSAAQAFVGHEPWVGQELRFRTAAGVDERRVVGVVDDVRYEGRDGQVHPMVYRPLTSLARTFAVVTDSDRAHELAGRIADTLASHGLRAPSYPIATLAQLEYEDDASDRTRSVVAVTGAVLNLALCGLGLAATLSAVLLRRVRDLAIRQALGASRSHLWLALAGGSSSAAAVGSAMGVGAYWLLSREGIAGALLPPVAAHQALACLLLAMVACALATLPAWRDALRMPIVPLLASE